jgi:O-antigen ligase
MTTEFAVDSSVLNRTAARAEERKRALSSAALLRACLFAVLLAAPLAFGAVQPAAWGTLAVAAFLLFLLWAWAGSRQGALRIFWSPLYVPAGFFFLLGIIQYAAHLTMDAMGTREALLKLATDLVFFFLALQFFAARQSGSATGVLRWPLLVYTFALALFAVLQFFSGPGLIYWVVKSPGWTFGPYVNHNHYAGLMEMLIPLSCACALPALRKHPAAVVPVSCFILVPVASLLLSGSRGGCLALLVEAVLAALLVLGFGPREAHRRAAVVGGGALLSAALLFLWMAPRPATERLTKLGDGTHPPDVELGNRLEAARDSLAIWRHHPWLGAGLGSFESVFPRYQSFPSEARWDHAHNDYLEALAETGLAGAAAIAIALLLFFWLAFRNLRERLREPAGWLGFAAALGCCGILVHSLADFNLHMPANAAWFAACAALAVSASDE